MEALFELVAEKVALRVLLEENSRLLEANADLKIDLNNANARPAILSEQLDMMAKKAEWFEASLIEIYNGSHMHNGYDPCPMDCPVSIAKEALARK